MQEFHKRLKDYDDDQKFAEKILMKPRQKESLEEELGILNKKSEALFSEFKSVKEIIDAVVNGNYMDVKTESNNGQVKEANVDLERVKMQ